MTNPIPAAAIEAGAKARAEARGTDWENLKHTFPGMANNIRSETRSALEAAMPHIRKQIAEEIRYGINEYSGQLIEQAARIAEGGPK